MLTTTLVVPAGPYFGFTLSELETELTAYKAARVAFSTSLASASVNGQSFQFADLDKQRAALDTKQIDLQIAFAYLDPGRFPMNPPGNTSAATLC